MNTEADFRNIASLPTHNVLDLEEDATYVGPNLRKKIQALKRRVTLNSIETEHEEMLCCRPSKEYLPGNVHTVKIRQMVYFSIYGQKFWSCIKCYNEILYKDLPGYDNFEKIIIATLDSYIQWLTTGEAACS